MAKEGIHVCVGKLLEKQRLDITVPVDFQQLKQQSWLLHFSNLAAAGLWMMEDHH